MNASSPRVQDLARCSFSNDGQPHDGREHGRRPPRPGQRNHKFHGPPLQETRDQPRQRQPEEFADTAAVEDAVAQSTNQRQMFCLMLTMMIMCGAAVLVAVLVAAFIFMAQNK